MYSKVLLAAALAAVSANAQTEDDRRKYADWAAVMDQHGYTWQPYETVTEDGWTLTMFRITGRTHEDGTHTERKPLPVLVQHGWSMDALVWADWNGEGGETVWPLKLVDRGYDVWMTNQRATRYSNVNRSDGDWPDEVRYDYSQAEMGIYDQPAFIEKILEVTGKPKLTYVGYSQGTTQMIYGLAKMNDWFADRLSNVLLVSPCLYDEGAWFKSDGTYEGVSQMFYEYKRNGIYTVGGPQWPETIEKMCRTPSLGQDLCEYWKAVIPESRATAPIKSLYWVSQNYVEDQFAEIIPIEQYVKGDRDLKPISLSAIDDRIPITLFIGDEDTLCTPEVGARIYDEMTNADKHQEHLPWDHLEFAKNGSDEFTDQIASFIAKDQEEMSIWETLSLFDIFFDDGASNLLATSAAALTTFALAF